MTTHDTRPGSTGGADVPGPLYGGPDDDYTPEQLAAMDREQLDRLGARYDGVEILHVDPGPAPGSNMEKRAIRQVGMVFTLAGLFAFLFIVVYVGSGWFLPDWHWQVTESGWIGIGVPSGYVVGSAMSGRSRPPAAGMTRTVSQESGRTPRDSEPPALRVFQAQVGLTQSLACSARTATPSATRSLSCRVTAAFTPRNDQRRDAYVRLPL